MLNRIARQSLMLNRIARQSLMLNRIARNEDGWNDNRVWKAKVDCVVSPSVDVRGHHAPMKKFDKNLIKEHINSYHSQVSRYNREHAPNRRYLESHLSITDKWSDFTNKYKKISYELYRQVFESEKITLGELSQDECEFCLVYNLHVKESGDHDEACEKYIMGKDHLERARKLIQRIFLDSVIAKSFTCGEKKCTYVVCYG